MAIRDLLPREGRPAMEVRQQPSASSCRNGPFAWIVGVLTNVGFTPESGHAPKEKAAGGVTPRTLRQQSQCDLPQRSRNVLERGVQASTERRHGGNDRNGN